MRKCYLDDSYSFENYLISPLYAPYELLKKFPQTEIMISLDDPLADDAFSFAEKLLIANVNVHITEYPDACHSALFLRGKNGVPSFANIIDDSIKIFKKLLVALVVCYLNGFPYYALSVLLS